MGLLSCLHAVEGCRPLQTSQVSEAPPIRQARGAAPLPGPRLLYSVGDSTVRAPATFAFAVCLTKRSKCSSWMVGAWPLPPESAENQLESSRTGASWLAGASSWFPGALAPPSDRAGARGAMSEMGACRRARYCVATGSGLAYARFGLADGQSHQPPTEEPDHNFRERLPVSTTPQRSSAQESATAIGAYLFAGRVMSSRVPAVASWCRIER